MSLAGRTGATVIANYEVESVRLQHVGGGFHHPFGYLKLNPALRASGLPDGSCGGSPCGFLLKAEGKTLYLACDTGLFGDVALIGEQGVGFATLPVGDNFTMGPDDALRATALIKPRFVVPIRHNTRGDHGPGPARAKSAVEASSDTQVFPLSPEDSLTI